MADVITADQMLHMGLMVVSSCYGEFDGKSMMAKTSCFRSHFGVGPAAVAALYSDLQSLNIDHAFARISLRRLLIALFWIKTYSTETLMTSKFHLTEKTIRKHCLAYVQSIAALRRHKIRWTQTVAENDQTFVVTVDGTHCEINEPRDDPSSKWFSHKSHGPGLAYELAISIRESRLVWINGPFPASVNDRTIYKTENGLRSTIPDGCLGIGDEGYTNEDKLSTANSLDSRELAEFKQRARARHEIFNGRLKVFNVLKNKFRHHRDRHLAVFETCCVLVQYDMENGNPLFDV